MDYMFVVSSIFIFRNNYFLSCFVYKEVSDIMQIYPIEIQDGLKDQIANSKISMACELFTKNGLAHSNTDILVKTLANANPNQRDLFYRYSILASVGWNANDDVFDRVETWNARLSSVDKQINFMHNELEIIGHSTSSSVFDTEGNIIPDDTPLGSLPPKFDVVTEFVLYSMWENKERQEMMQKLISEINEGKWFVSMECRFPAFDYAIIDVDGSHKTVARNENTAFLTKHLKAFGGTGEYEGRRIGRLIKNFFFSGQGIVNKPANVRSIIFNNAISFNSKGSLLIKGNKQMEDELKRQVAELQAQVANFNKKHYEDTIASLNQQLAEAKTALTAAFKAKDDDEKDKKEKDDKAMCALKEKDKAISTLTDELKASQDKLTVANAELASIKKDIAFASRASKLVVAGFTDETAKAEVTKWASLDDAQFDEIVAMHKAKAEALKASAGAGATTTTTAKLEEAVVETPAPLNTATSSVVEDSMKTITEFLGRNMQYSAQATKLEQNRK